MTTSDCLSVHSTVDVTSSTIKNFESLLKFRDDIKKKKEEEQTKLVLAIEKRQEIQDHLAQVSESLKMALDEVKQQEEVNNAHLVEMISQLERSISNPHQVAAEGQDDPFLMELVSLNNFDPDKLGEKVAKSMQAMERKLAVATEMATILTEQKSRILVRVVDSKNQTGHMLECGFNCYGPDETRLSPIKRDFLLLFHIVYSIKNRGSKNHQSSLSLVDESTEKFQSARSLTNLNTAQQVKHSEESASHLPVVPNLSPSQTNLHSARGRSVRVVPRGRVQFIEEMARARPRGPTRGRNFLPLY